MSRIVTSGILALLILLASFVSLRATAALPLTVEANNLNYSALIFLTPTVPGAGDCIVTNLAGEVIYRRVISPGRCLNFHRIVGDRWVSWDTINAAWQVQIPHREIIGEYRLVDGKTDTHDLIVGPDYVWLMGRRVFNADLSRYGGRKDTRVLASVLQKQDKAGNVLFDWDSRDYIGFDEAALPLNKYPQTFPHSNSFIEDTDGNLVVSFRNIDAVLKICTTGDGCQMGEILWRAGGKLSDFEIADPYYKQHSAFITKQCYGETERCLVLFDNGNDRGYSRAVEYALDEAHLILTRTWEYSAGGSILAVATGNVTRLSNGDTVIGWGAGGGAPGAPNISIVNKRGELKYQASLPEEQTSYRAYVYPEWRHRLPMIYLK